MSEGELKDRMAKIFVARFAILEKHGKARGVRGEMSCPVCNSGRLNYGISELNGHIRGVCSTKDCVCWIE